VPSLSTEISTGVNAWLTAHWPAAHWISSSVLRQFQSMAIAVMGTNSKTVVAKKARMGRPSIISKRQTSGCDDLTTGETLHDNGRDRDIMRQTEPGARRPAWRRTHVARKTAPLPQRQPQA
jgi:hypothetical protein